LISSTGKISQSDKSIREIALNVFCVQKYLLWAIHSDCPDLIREIEIVLKRKKAAIENNVRNNKLDVLPSILD